MSGYSFKNAELHYSNQSQLNASLNYMWKISGQLRHIRMLLVSVYNYGMCTQTDSRGLIAVFPAPRPLFHHLLGLGMRLGG